MGKPWWQDAMAGKVPTPLNLPLQCCQQQKHKCHWWWIKQKQKKPTHTHLGLVIGPLNQLFDTNSYHQITKPSYSLRETFRWDRAQTDFLSPDAKHMSDNKIGIYLQDLNCQSNAHQLVSSLINMKTDYSQLSSKSYTSNLYWLESIVNLCNIFLERCHFIQSSLQILSFFLYLHFFSFGHKSGLFKL